MSRHIGVHKNQHSEASAYLGELLMAGRLDDWIAAHAEHDEDTGCMLWELGMANHGRVCMTRLPRFLPPKPGRMRMVQVARMVWEIRHNRVVPAGQVVYRTCNELRCIAPAHLRCGTREKLGELHKRMGTAKHTAASRIKITAVNRARSAASVEIVQKIREEMAGVKYGERTAKYKELADKYKLKTAVVQNICLGKSWNDAYAAGAFQGLIALSANDEREAA